MVTHDLRMCQYVDRVLQMPRRQTGQNFLSTEEIQALARGE